MNVFTFTGFMRYLVYMVLSFNCMFSSVSSHAGKEDLPDFYGTESADKKEIGSAFKKLIDIVIYVAGGAMALGMAIGLLMLAPFVGQPKMGIQAIKGSAIGMAGVLFFWSIVALFSSIQG
ncbi:MAG: hypothetical protein HRU20_21580 [Pseudomonadales bacterium]|nr:hypothetical protein [Pseudomonadales bacterium]